MNVNVDLDHRTKFAQVIFNIWVTPQGTGPVSSNQPRKVSEDQDAKKPKKADNAHHSKLGQLVGRMFDAGVMLALLTEVILVMRFSYESSFTLDHLKVIGQSGVTILLVAMPYPLALACLIAAVFTAQNMHWDNNWIKNFDACKTIGNLTCLVIGRIKGPDKLDASEAIQQLQSAGITVRMVTGEEVYSARKTAIICGIIRPDEDFLVLEGKAFNERIRDSAGDVKQELFDKVWPRLRVLAASTPNDKYLLVKHIMESKLNLNREVVAVTGQGSDDIPVLKKADIGFVLGIVGTDVAKEAADIVLTDDRISSIVKAVMWGRNVHDLIAKFLQFQLSVNWVVVIVEVVCACALQNSPFSAVHLLWIYLFVCSLASFGLCTGMPDPAILLRKPYGRTKPIISGIMLRNIIGQAVYQLVIIFILLFAGADIFQIKSGSKAVKLMPSPNYLGSEAEDILPTQHLTIIFNTFSLMTLFNGLNARLIHGQRNIFDGLLSNPIFGVTFFMTATAQIVIVQFGGKLFNTAPLTYYQWMWCFILGASVLLWGQVLSAIPLKRIPAYHQVIRVSLGQSEKGINCKSSHLEDGFPATHKTEGLAHSTYCAKNASLN